MWLDTQVFITIRNLGTKWYNVKSIRNKFREFIYFPNGRYIDCLSLPYATDNSKT